MRKELQAIIRDKIQCNEFTKDTFFVAKNVLLGSYLYTCFDGKLTGGIVTEVEVYIGGLDKASHSYKGKRTKRTEVQFSPGGVAYVFLIYGMHAQFCVVTNEKDISDVVLIRSLQPTLGLDIMSERRKTSKKICSL